jgi:selenocysteine lyase/cysteine desulfurase
MDLETLRRDTPGTTERVHMNNAGAALQPQPVLDTVSEHLALEARIGGYEAADARAEQIESARATVGELIAAEPANVAFCEHATAAFAAALSSVPFKSGDTLVTTRNDYVSNQLMYLSLERRLGIHVLKAPDTPEGGVDVMALEELVHKSRPRLVAVTHVPTNSGLVQDVAAVGEVCKRKDALYLVDACQSVGQMIVDVRDLSCDFLSATARKFLRGPRGVGFLYVSERALEMGLEPMFIDLRGADWTLEDLYQPAPDARRFETWEFAYALVLGMGAAARYALEVGVEEASRRAWQLAARVRDGLTRIDGVRVLDKGLVRSAIVTAHVPGWDPPALVRALRERGINTSAIDRASAVLDMDEKGVEGALRMSPHYYNTDDEVDVLVEAVSALAANPSGGSSRTKRDKGS